MAEEEIALFRVTGTFERTYIDEQGKFKRVYEIKFVTKSGVQSSVEVSKVRYTKDKGIEAVRKLAEELEATMTTRE